MFYKGEGGSMKLLICPDFHLTEKAPEKRIDDFAETSLNKLNFVYKTAVKNNVDVVLQSGDFTNEPTMSYKFLIKLIKCINKYDMTTVTIHGQHSLRYRTRGNTVLDAIEYSCPNLFILDDTFMGRNNIRIYGVGYGGEIPKPKKDNKFSILLIHKMIVGSKKIWEGQTNITWAKNFLMKNEFDLIVSGDNHAQFMCDINERQFLFNCGTLLRNESDMVDYQPHLILFNTQTLKYKKILVPIKSFDEVFKVDEINKGKNNDKEMEEFIKGIRNYKNTTLKFKKNLLEYLKENNIEDEIKNVFKEAFEFIGKNK